MCERSPEVQKALIWIEGADLVDGFKGPLGEAVWLTASGQYSDQIIMKRCANLKRALLRLAERLRVANKPE